jgi:hypothetical protein
LTPNERRHLSNFYGKWRKVESREQVQTDLLLVRVYDYYGKLENILAKYAVNGWSEVAMGGIK